MKWFTGMFARWSVRACWRLGYGRSLGSGSRRILRGRVHALVSNCLAARGWPPRSATGLYPSAGKRERRFTCCACAMMAAIAAGTACTGSKYRVDLLENENHEKGKVGSSFLLWTCVPFLAGWAGAQSNPHGATSSGNRAPPVSRTEQQEMRDELKALRAEVDTIARGSGTAQAGVSGR